MLLHSLFKHFVSTSYFHSRRQSICLQKPQLFGPSHVHITFKLCWIYLAGGKHTIVEMAGQDHTTVQTEALLRPNKVSVFEYPRVIFYESAFSLCQCRIDSNTLHAHNSKQKPWRTLSIRCSSATNNIISSLPNLFP